MNFRLDLDPFLFPESVWAQGSSNSEGLYLIFSSSHLLIFTPSLTSSHLHIFSPFSLPFLSLAFFIFLSLGRGWCRRGVTKREPFRTKWGLIAKNWGKIAILLVPEQPFRTKWGSIAKSWGKIAILLAPKQPFRTKWGSMRKNWGKIAILLVPDVSVCKSVCV